MGAFKDWWLDFLDHKRVVEISPEVLDFLNKTTTLAYNQYAQAIVAEKYGSLLAQCDFITYVNGEIVEKDNWYRLNVEPNKNQSSSEFMKQLAKQLIMKGEALIVKTDDGDLWVAKDFMKANRQVGEMYFENVWVDIYEDRGVSSYNLKGTFRGENAIYIKYMNANALAYIEQMNELYTELIDEVKRSGSTALKYSMEIDTQAINGRGVDVNKEIAKMVNENFEALVSNKSAIIPLLNGFKLDVLNKNNLNAQNSTTATANISQTFSDVLVNVGLIYNMPKSFMLGTYEKNDMDEFLTFGLDPLCTLIGECFNRTYYGKKQIMAKTYCRLDTKKVKHFDILTISDTINKLVSSGVYSINEVRTLLDEPLIDAEIGDKHWVTRNYAVIGDYLQESTNYTANDPKTQKSKGGNDGKDTN